MAINDLFPPGGYSSGQHFAMLDGRRASFACSIVDKSDITEEESRNWQWSADLAHHVVLTPNEVRVRSGRDPFVRKFQRRTVEAQLEEFLNFLDSSRRSALPDVVPFLTREFQTTWAAGYYATGESALAAFLLALHTAGESDIEILNDSEWRRNIVLAAGLDPSEVVMGDMNTRIREDALRIKEGAPFGLRLVPSLVLRHVSGRLFQEAHAVLESVQYGLFGGSTVVTKPTYSPAGAYFTPVPIARLLAEWAIEQRSSLPDKLTIADFACGSGVFLTESLRTLERLGFHGNVRLIGRDKSIQAITMAKVAVRAVQLEIGAMQITTDIVQADALDCAWPEADIVLMNPPFRSWERMNDREREWVHDVTKGAGRPDLSVGFIERGINALKGTAGVLATLLPAGVLASHTLSKWRDELLQRVTPNLVAVLGEHGLFHHALVNVGILGLQSGSAGTSHNPVHVAWSSAESGAAAKLIRAIRRSISPRDDFSVTAAMSGWSVTTTPLDVWKRRPSWLPGAGALGSLLQRLESGIDTTVDDLFIVRQGIRTGAKNVFIQPERIIKSLPSNEQKYFREAVDAASFIDGNIKPENYLFVPDPDWRTESSVREAVPTFFQAYLKPNDQSLRQRKRKSSDNSRWWELTWPRGWAFNGKPRLVSKRFGLYPAFARDFLGQLAVVQANAWIPTKLLEARGGEDALRELLTAYWWILNSRITVALFREYCPNVAGGQLDLEHKYVKNIPMPHVGLRIEEDPALQLLASSIRTRYGDLLPPTGDRDHFAAAVFRTDVSEWNVTGLESTD